MCAFGAALSADAQENYVVDDPSIDPTITACAQGGIYDVFALGDAAIEKLAANSKIKVNDYRVATDETVNSHYPGGNADGPATIIMQQCLCRPTAVASTAWW